MELYFGSAHSLQIPVLLTGFHERAVLVFGTYLSGKRTWFHFLLPLFLDFLSALLPSGFRCRPFPGHVFLRGGFIVHVLLGEEIEHFRFIPFLFAGCRRCPAWRRSAFYHLHLRLLFIRIGGKQVEHGFIRLGGKETFCLHLLPVLYCCCFRWDFRSGFQDSGNGGTGQVFLIKFPVKMVSHILRQ